MRPAKTLTPSLTLASILIAAACVTVAVPASAQQRVSNPADGRGPGMRYLSWPGKAERPRVAPTPAPQPMSAVPDAMDVPRPAPSSAPITSFAAPPPATTTRATRYSARSGPTPASAWIGNGGAPGPAPLPAYQPPVEPAYVAPSMASTPPEPAYEAPPVYAPPPRPMLERRVETAPVYAPPVMMPEPPRGYPPISPVPPPRYASAYDTPRDETPGDRGGFGPPRYEVPLDAPPAYAEASRDDRGDAYPMPQPMMPESIPMPVPTRPVAADSGPAVTETIVEQPMPEAPPPPAREAPIASPAPVVVAPPAEPAFDPMAPRRDAPIFRMLGRNTSPAPMDDRAVVPEPTPEPAPDAAPQTTPPPLEAEPAPQAQAQPAPPPGSVDRSPRRYSVHRANGQAPDRTPLPDPVFLDSAPIDLAEPPEAPTVMRNVNGRIQAITPSEDPVLP